MTIWTPQSPTIQRWNPTESVETTLKVLDSNYRLAQGPQISVTPIYDLATNVAGGREPKTFTLGTSNFPAGMLYLEPGGRLQVSGGLTPGAPDQQFIAQVNVRDANDQTTSFTVTLGAFDPNAPMSIVGVYPDAHKNAPFDFTPLVYGGNPPFFFLFVGLDLANRGFSFDQNSARTFGAYTGGLNGLQLFTLKGWSLGGLQIGATLDFGHPDAVLNGGWNWFDP